MRKLVTPIFLLGFFLSCCTNAPVASAQGAVTDAVPVLQLSNLNIQNLPFCDVSLKDLLEMVNQAKQTSGSLESLYSYLSILYHEKKGNYQSGSSSLDPDQVDYCRFTKLDDESGDLEIPILYYSLFYFGLGHGIGKMVISAQGDHAVIRSLDGFPTNIKLYFNPPDIKVTKENLMSLLQSSVSNADGTWGIPSWFLSLSFNLNSNRISVSFYKYHPIFKAYDYMFFYCPADTYYGIPQTKFYVLDRFLESQFFQEIPKNPNPKDPGSFYPNPFVKRTIRLRGIQCDPLQ